MSTESGREPWTVQGLAVHSAGLGFCPDKGNLISFVFLKDRPAYCAKRRLCKWFSP